MFLGNRALFFESTPIIPFSGYVSRVPCIFRKLWDRPRVILLCPSIYYKKRLNFTRNCFWINWRSVAPAITTILFFTYILLWWRFTIKRLEVILCKYILMKIILLFGHGFTWQSNVLYYNIKLKLWWVVFI